MDSNACLQLLRRIKNAAFATVDALGHPQARIIDVMLIEDEKLYFVTARGKNFHRELTSSGKAAITALSKNFEMIRLNGEVTKPSDQKQWIDKIFEQNPSIREVYPGDSRYILDAFCIGRAEIEYFDLGCSPVYRESFAIGGMAVSKKGYQINESCIGCGKCAEACPQKCIEREGGGSYQILQNNCLHCGLCLETCPANAVTNRENALC